MIVSTVSIENEGRGEDSGAGAGIRVAAPSREQAMKIIASIGDAFDGQFALRLKASARALGLECELFDRTPRGRDRTRLNALIRGLSDHRGEDLLYVDPDAHLLRRPDILLDERDFDVGVYYDSKTLDLSGPIFVRGNSRGACLLGEWSALNATLPDSPEMDNLSRVLSRPGLRLDVRRFPVTYAWVERQHRPVHPKAQPVIVHFKTDGLMTGRLTVPKSRHG